VWPIADRLDAAHAAALGVAYKTAWGALADGELKRGDTLLVQAGSSGTGQAAIDIGRHLGATVYATASESKHDRVRELGAEPLAYDDPQIDELEAAVVFDPVGGAAFARSLRALGTGGRLVTPGAIDDPVVTFELWPLINRKQRIIGTGAARTTRDDFAAIVELAGAGELRPVVDRELPLADAAEAHRLIESRGVFGKIVLRPDL
jgi:NADPH:quinone reductase-like Zn-dependent oxidoreductase